MNQAHLHLLMNHFPIIGTIFAFLTLFIGILLKEPGIKKAGLGLFVLTGLLTIPAFFTGEGAEEVLNSAVQNADAYEEKHEELAGIAIWTCSIIGLLSFIVLLIEKKYSFFCKILSIIILILTVGNGLLLKNIGTSGGEIRHSEIRSNNSGNINRLDQNTINQESEEEEGD